jgi:xanthine dehydrogenase accessory factor
MPQTLAWRDWPVSSGHAYNFDPMHAENSIVEPLLPLFGRERAAGHACALGVLVHTEGSTYRKPGAMLLIARSGEYAGLLSGGCLEGDLSEHARTVIESGEARVVDYDFRTSSDEIWGLGLGCEGAMRILLVPVNAANGWQPLTLFSRALAEHVPAAVAIVVAPRPGGPRLGAISPVTTGSTTDAGSLIVRLALPPRLLLLGGGPDALPVVDLAARLGWRVTVVDHRETYARSQNFPQAAAVLCRPAAELAAAVELGSFEAALVMSHHLDADRSYLTALAPSAVGFVGLLGPPARRARLIADLGPRAENLKSRLRAPVGLALGGRGPESIALAIVAQLHAHFHGVDAPPLAAF